VSRRLAIAAFFGTAALGLAMPIVIDVAIYHAQFDWRFRDADAIFVLTVVSSFAAGLAVGGVVYAVLRGAARRFVIGRVGGVLAAIAGFALSPLYVEGPTSREGLAWALLVFPPFIFTWCILAALMTGIAGFFLGCGVDLLRRRGADGDADDRANPGVS